MDKIALLADLRDTLIETASKSREVERIGGFAYLRNPADTLIWTNSSIPVEECTVEDARALVRRYAETGRTPFLEFSIDLSPAVPPVLEKAGLVCLMRAPVMLLDQAAYRPVAYRDRARIPNPKELEEGIAVSAAAFGFPPPQADRTERAIEAIGAGRMLAAVGVDGERVVAAGQAVGNRRVREVVGIGTLPEFRRRGYAAAVIGCLLDQFLDSGGEFAWLTPADDGAESLYTKLGFEPSATQVFYGPPGLKL